MDNRNIESILQEVMEEQIPASQVDLWTGVKERLVAGNDLLTRQGEKMNGIKPRRLSRAILVTFVIIALLALVLITPQGRAFAQNILHFFIRSESDAIPIPTAEPLTWVDVTPGMPSPTRTPLPAMAIFAKDCGDYGNSTCTVEQIREKVDFTVKELGRIPSGLYFVGATGGPDNVFLLYSYENQSGSLAISVERWAGIPSPQSDLIGVSAVVEEVHIGGLAGEYFKGSFVSQADDNVARWDPDFGMETLRWVEEGVSYRIQYSYPSKPLGKEGMVALAESLTTEPVAKLPMPVSTSIDVWNPSDTYNLSVSEAEQQAGFKLVLPLRLPEILSLVGASYDGEHKIVEVFYLLDQNLYGPTTEGVSLSQQIASNPADCFLCDISVDDYNKFAKEAGNTKTFKEIVPSRETIENVHIGALTGKYIQGVWSGTDCCGWVWDPTAPRKVLRWWSNGMAFEIKYFGGSIEKEVLITIAENMK